jgi:Vitamin K-dependent gamma-carboxylase
MTEPVPPPAPPSRDCVVGLAPWLPWPLCAWRVWTEPVRAERLALLRIGVALCLLLDITLQTVPLALDFYGKEYLGQPRLMNWRFQPSRLNWSLLRGVGADGIPFLSLTAWLLSTCWLFGIPLARLFARHEAPPQDRTGFALMIWTAAWVCYVAGLWTRLDAGDDELAWIVPLTGVGMVFSLTGLELVVRWRVPQWSIPWRRLAFVAVVELGLLGAGLGLAHAGNREPSSWWMRLLGPWQNDDNLLLTAVAFWIACTGLLMIGSWTRTMAVLTYLLTMSFANLNTYIDNSGDVIRNILLFYLMLCPCGAAWSVDAWRRRRSTGGAPQHVFVHPWPIRLIFLQMTIIYFMNGLHKIAGADWRDGTSLHYVLGDLTFVRLPQTWLPLPLIVTRILTWFVLVWELTFPLLMVWKWPRRIALVCGVMFHLGIFALMEIGFFSLYALCLYLPLVPIGREERGRESSYRGQGWPVRCGD